MPPFRVIINDITRRQLLSNSIQLKTLEYHAGKVEEGLPSAVPLTPLFLPSLESVNPPSFSLPDNVVWTFASSLNTLAGEREDSFLFISENLRLPLFSVYNWLQLSSFSARRCPPEVLRWGDRLSSSCNIWWRGPWMVTLLDPLIQVKLLV